MPRAKKPILCSNCGGEVATATAPTAAVKGSGSRTARLALYTRYQALGFQPCPTCRDYVDLSVHNCEMYQSIWLITRSMDEFARSLAKGWDLGTIESDPLPHGHPDYWNRRQTSFRTTDVVESIAQMARAGDSPMEVEAVA